MFDPPLERSSPVVAWILARTKRLELINCHKLSCALWDDTVHRKETLAVLTEAPAFALLRQLTLT